MRGIGHHNCVRRVTIAAGEGNLGELTRLKRARKSRSTLGDVHQATRRRLGEGSRKSGAAPSKCQECLRLASERRVGKEAAANRGEGEGEEKLSGSGT